MKACFVISNFLPPKEQVVRDFKIHYVSFQSILICFCRLQNTVWKLWGWETSGAGEETAEPM